MFRQNGPMKKSSCYILQAVGILLLLMMMRSVLAVDWPYPKNELKFGYYNRGFIYLDCPHPPSPIFWEALAKVKNGIQLNYQRLLYDNGGRFGVFIGAGFSRYKSFDTNYIYAESLFPVLRYWFIRTQHVDLYFDYSVAGPTILSHRTIGEEENGVVKEKDLGGYFIFQDFLGLGAVMGRRHAFNIDVRLVHYSNGDILPRNPGFDVPIMVYLGYSF